MLFRSSYNPWEMRHCKQLLNKLPFDDYDRLIQLCDRLSVGVTYNIKERMKFIQNTYRLPVALVKKKYREALQLKKYFAFSSEHLASACSTKERGISAASSSIIPPRVIP